MIELKVVAYLPLHFMFLTYRCLTKLMVTVPQIDHLNTSCSAEDPPDASALKGQLGFTMFDFLPSGDMSGPVRVMVSGVQGTA